MEKREKLRRGSVGKIAPATDSDNDVKQVTQTTVLMFLTYV